MKILPPCSALKAEPARKPDPGRAQGATTAERGGRYIFLSLAFFAFFSIPTFAVFPEDGSSSAAAGDTRKRDAALSGTLLEGARNALGLGYMLEAVELVDEAIDYAPANSDALHLRALCGLALKEPYAKIGIFLERALAANQFFYYSREDSLMLYGAFLVRTGNYWDALNFLSGLRHNPLRDSLEAEALRLSGNPEKARDALFSLIGRYPSEAAYCIPWLLSLDSETKTAADARLVAELFRLLPGIKERSMNFLAAMVPFAGTLEESRFLLREFRAMGGSSAESTVLSMKYGLVTEDDAIKELFSGAYPLFSESVRQLFGNLGSDQTRQSFLKTFLSFSGTIASDYNRDGIAEFSVTYGSGQALSAVVDKNQDDLAEMLISFADGMPCRANVVTASLDVEFSYGIWPYLDTVTFTGRQGGKSYSVKPSSLGYRILDLDVLGRFNGRSAVLYGNSAIPLLSEQQVLSNSIHVSEKTARKKQSVDLIDGMPVQSWYSLQTGLTATVFYENGLARYEQVDLNQDGRFEARKTWALNKDGESVPVEIRIDANADGIFEYRESLAEPFGKNWDLDDNGSFDLNQVQENAGRLRYEFSSRLDGNFDIVLVYSAGQIVQAFKNGKELALVPDAGGKVVWLGKKPFDFGAQVPIPGWGVRAPVRFFVLSIADTLYAEILE